MPTVGDTSCDGHIDARDAALILQRDNEVISLFTCSSNGDANADGRTDSLDAALILQYTAGLIDHLG
jgi:hypothetical protein